jgi:hypothetical protein
MPSSLHDQIVSRVFLFIVEANIVLDVMVMNDAPPGYEEKGPKCHPTVPWLSL